MLSQYISGYHSHVLAKKRLISEQEQSTSSSSSSSSSSSPPKKNDSEDDIYLSLSKRRSLRKKSSSNTQTDTDIQIAHLSFSVWLRRNYPRHNLLSEIEEYPENIKDDINRLYENDNMNIHETDTLLTQISSNIENHYIEEKKRIDSERELSIQQAYEKEQRINSVIPNIPPVNTRIDNDVWIKTTYKLTPSISREIMMKYYKINDLIQSIFVNFIEIIYESPKSCIEFAKMPITPYKESTSNAFNESVYYLSVILESSELEKHFIINFQYVAQMIYWKWILQNEEYASSEKIISESNNSKEQYIRHLQEYFWPTFKRIIYLHSSDIQQETVDIIYKTFYVNTLISSIITQYIYKCWEDENNRALNSPTISYIEYNITIPLMYVFMNLEDTLRQSAGALISTTSSSTSSSSSSSSTSSTMSSNITYSTTCFLKLSEMLGITSNVEMIQIIDVLIKIGDQYEKYVLSSSMIEDVSQQNIVKLDIEEMFTKHKYTKRCVESYLNLDSRMGLILSIVLCNPFIYNKQCDILDYIRLIMINEDLKSSSSSIKFTSLKSVFETRQYPQQDKSSDDIDILFKLRRIQHESISKTKPIVQKQPNTFLEKVTELAQRLLTIDTTMTKKSIEHTMKMCTERKWKEYASKNPTALNFFYNVIKFLHSVNGLNASINEKTFDLIQYNKNISDVIENVLRIDMKTKFDLIISSFNSHDDIYNFMKKFISSSRTDQRMNLMHLSLYVTIKTNSRFESIFSSQKQEAKRETKKLNKYLLEHKILFKYNASIQQNDENFDKIHAFISAHILASRDLKWSNPKNALIFNLNVQLQISSAINPFILLNVPDYDDINNIIINYIRPLIVMLESSFVIDPSQFTLSCDLEQLFLQIQQSDFTITTPFFPIREEIYLTGLVSFCRYFVSKFINTHDIIIFTNILYTAQEHERNTFYQILLMLDYVLTRQCCLSSIIKNINFNVEPLSLNDSLTLYMNISENADYSYDLYAIRNIIKSDETFKQRCWFVVPNKLQPELINRINDKEFISQHVLNNCSISSDVFENDDAFITWFHQQSHRDLHMYPQHGKIYFLTDFLSHKQ